MDIKNTIEWATRREKEYNKHERNAYDWERDGILIKCLPKILFGAMPVLVTFLQLIDMRIIMVVKTAKRLREFKHISVF